MVGRRGCWVDFDGINFQSKLSGKHLVSALAPAHMTPSQPDDYAVLHGVKSQGSLLSNDAMGEVSLRVTRVAGLIRTPIT